MSRIEIRETGKDLTCIICNSDTFNTEEVEMKTNVYRSSYYGEFVDGNSTETVEMITCRDCGWTTFFKKSNGWGNYIEIR